MADIIKRDEQKDMMAEANSLAKSKMVPDHFRNSPADCYFAHGLAVSLSLPTIEVMRALYPSKGGKWGWSTEFMVAQLIRSGCIQGTLHYEEVDEPPDFKVRCWAIDSATGERVDGPWITAAIVKAEGWERNAKHKTIPREMRGKRAATWFIRRQYPNVLMGHRPMDELQDMESSAVEERKELQAAAESRYSPANVVEVEAEVIEPADVKFTNCEPCSGAGCVLCEGTGVVPE